MNIFSFKENKKGVYVYFIYLLMIQMNKKETYEFNLEIGKNGNGTRYRPLLEKVMADNIRQPV